MLSLWEFCRHDLMDAPFGLMDAVFGLMGFSSTIHNEQLAMDNLEGWMIGFLLEFMLSYDEVQE